MDRRHAGVQGGCAGPHRYIEELPAAAVVPDDQAGLSRGLPFTMISVGVIAEASATSPRPMATLVTGRLQSTSTVLPTATVSSLAES